MVIACEINFHWILSSPIHLTRKAVTLSTTICLIDGPVYMQLNKSVGNLCSSFNYNAVHIYSPYNKLFFGSLPLP
jgi:hypothetical protein